MNGFQALEEMCGNKSICYGSPAFQKGVIKVCLHADDYVSQQVKLYENFTRCTDNLLNELIYQIEVTKEKMNELRYSKSKLIQEYSDSKNRYELEMVVIFIYLVEFGLCSVSDTQIIHFQVLEYHEEIINEDVRALLVSIEKLHQLYESLDNAMKNCSGHGYPRISKKVYTYANVRQCMRDFLTTEPHHGYVHVPEESLDPESEGTPSPEEAPENPPEQNQESQKEPNKPLNEPNQESPEGAQEDKPYEELYEEYRKKEGNNARDNAEIHGYPDYENHEDEDALDDDYYIHDD